MKSGKFFWPSNPIRKNYIIFYILVGPFPLQMILIAVFGGVIFILLLSIVCILFRKRLCCCCFDSEEENQNKKLKEKHLNADAKNLKKVNNIVDQLAGGATQLKKVNEIKIISHFFNCATPPMRSLPSIIHILCRL